MKNKLYLLLFIILFLFTSCEAKKDIYDNPYLHLENFPTTAYDPLYDDSFTDFKETTTEEEQENTNSKCTLAFLGDLVIQDGQLKDSYNANTGEYDFTIPFQFLQNDLKYADYTVANLETTFGPGSVSGSKKYCAPDDLAYDLKNLGINLVSLANNHALDEGQQGIIRTIGVLDSVGISHVGTSKSIDDYERKKGTFIADINGIKVGFVSLTRFTNGIKLPENNEKAVNVYVKDYSSNSQSQIDYNTINEQVTYAKENSDIVIALMHWGDKNTNLPSGQQSQLANYLVSIGVKIIIGTHPHAIQPMLYSKSEEKTNDFVIVYSIGNMLTTQTNNDGDISSMLYINIIKENNKTYIDDLYYEPITIIQRDRTLSPRYFVLNTEDTLNNLATRKNKNILSLMTDSIVKRLRATVEKCHEIFGEQYDYYVKANDISYNAQTFKYENLKDIFNANIVN